MDFFTKGSSEDFEKVFKLYQKAVKAKAEQKNKKKGESLLSLDKWMQEEVQSAADARVPPHLTQAELVRLVEWKVSRGKFRPTLVGLARSNEEAAVVKATGEGLKLGAKGKLKEAVKALVTLRGIGPATASAILAACRPDHFCFFADEVAAAALPPPAAATLRYTAEEYVALNGAVTLCAARLNVDSEEEVWTPHRVELAVWTYCVLEKTHSDLLPSFSSSSPPPSRKRKR